MRNKMRKTVLFEECNICSSNHHRLMGYSRNFQFLQCQDCGLNFVSPLPSNDMLYQYYNDFYAGQLVQEEFHEYINLAERSLRHQLSIVQELGGNFGPKKRFLDVGFGGGHYLVAAEKNGFVAYGVEIDRASFERARQMGLNVYNCHLNDSTVDNDFFDIVKAMHVLEHSRDPSGLLRDIFRVLRCDGFLIIDVPNQRSKIAKLKILLRYLSIKRESYGYLQPPIHLYAFNTVTLTKMLEKEGFEVMKVVYTFPGDQLYFPITARYYSSLRGKITKHLYWLFGYGSYISIYAKKPTRTRHVTRWR